MRSNFVKQIISYFEKDDQFFINFGHYKINNDEWEFNRKYIPF